MFIYTIGSGPCEVDVAALNINTLIAATNANVKVCAWSHDPRNNFAEVGTARVTTALGEAYMAQQLHLAGYTPVPDPGERAERSRIFAKALLEQVIEDSSHEHRWIFVNPHTGCLAQAGAEASKERLENKYYLTAVATKALPVKNAKDVCDNVEFVLCKTKDNKRQIWLHSKANKEYTLQIETFH